MIIAKQAHERSMLYQKESETNSHFYVNEVVSSFMWHPLLPLSIAYYSVLTTDFH